MEDLVSVPVLKRAAELLAAINPDMTIRSFQLLCLVAEAPGRNVTTYAQGAGLPMTTASRLLKDLTNEVSRSERRVTGAGLLIRQQSPVSDREVIYILSQKGKALLGKVTTVARQQFRGGDD